MQMDQNINLFDWPLVIECRECGDIIKGVYSRKGLSIKQLPYEQFSDHSIVTNNGWIFFIFAYCRCCIYERW